MEINTISKLIRSNRKIMDTIVELEAKLLGPVRSPWITIKQASEYAGYSESHFYKMYKKEIPYFQRGDRVMINVNDLEAWMEKNKKAPVRAGANH